MNVQELIDKLNKVADKSARVVTLSKTLSHTWRYDIDAVGLLEEWDFNKTEKTNTVVLSEYKVPACEEVE